MKKDKRNCGEGPVKRSRFTGRRKRWRMNKGVNMLEEKQGEVGRREEEPRVSQRNERERKEEEQKVSKFSEGKGVKERSKR